MSGASTIARLPVEALVADRDGMAFALMLAQRHGAGFEVATGVWPLWRARLSRNARIARSRPESALLKYQRASKFLLRSAAACSAV
jgi:hypothetical protein